LYISSKQNKKYYKKIAFQFESTISLKPYINPKQACPKVALLGVFGPQI
jgi:hypothetical protein